MAAGEVLMPRGTTGCCRRRPWCAPCGGSLRTRRSIGRGCAVRARRRSEFRFTDPEVFVPERLPGPEAIEFTIPDLLERLAGSAGAERYLCREAVRRQGLWRSSHQSFISNGTLRQCFSFGWGRAAAGFHRVAERLAAVGARHARPGPRPGTAGERRRYGAGGGSWGVRHPTAEETAYAVPALCVCVNSLVERPAATALHRAHIFLADCHDVGAADSTRTPLWHYKNLGSAFRIERLYTLTALLMSGSPLR